MSPLVWRNLLALFLLIISSSTCSPFSFLDSFYNIFHMLAILDWFMSSFAYYSFSFAPFLGKFLQIYILNLSCSYLCYLIFSFYKLSFLLCIFHFCSIIQCLLHYWKYLWHFGGGVVFLWKSFYFLWFLKSLSQFWCFIFRVITFLNYLVIVGFWLHLKLGIGRLIEGSVTRVKFHMWGSLWNDMSRPFLKSPTINIFLFFYLS